LDRVFQDILVEFSKMTDFQVFVRYGVLFFRLVVVRPDKCEQVKGMPEKTKSLKSLLTKLFL
jgi:hypothetical protein